MMISRIRSMHKTRSKYGDTVFPKNHSASGDYSRANDSAAAVPFRGQEADEKADESASLLL